MTKTHSGLITTFSLRFVKDGEFPVELGKALNRVAELRQNGDYTGMTTPEDKAGWAVAQAASFVAAVERLLTKQAER